MENISSPSPFRVLKQQESKEFCFLQWINSHFVFEKNKIHRINELSNGFTLLLLLLSLYSREKKEFSLFESLKKNLPIFFQDPKKSKDLNEFLEEKDVVRKKINEKVFNYLQSVEGLDFSQVDLDLFQDGKDKQTFFDFTWILILRFHFFIVNKKNANNSNNVYEELKLWANSLPSLSFHFKKKRSSQNSLSQSLTQTPKIISSIESLSKPSTLFSIIQYLFHPYTIIKDRKSSHKNQNFEEFFEKNERMVKNKLFDGEFVEECLNFAEKNMFIPKLVDSFTFCNKGTVAPLTFTSDLKSILTYLECFRVFHSIYIAPFIEKEENSKKYPTLSHISNLDFKKNEFNKILFENDYYDKDDFLPNNSDSFKTPNKSNQIKDFKGENNSFSSPQIYLEKSNEKNEKEIGDKSSLLDEINFLKEKLDVLEKLKNLTNEYLGELEPRIEKMAKELSSSENNLKKAKEENRAILEILSTFSLVPKNFQHLIFEKRKKALQNKISIDSNNNEIKNDNENDNKIDSNDKINISNDDYFSAEDLEIAKGNKDFIIELVSLRKYKKMKEEEEKLKKDLIKENEIKINEKEVQTRFEVFKEKVDEKDKEILSEIDKKRTELKELKIKMENLRKMIPITKLN